MKDTFEQLGIDFEGNDEKFKLASAFEKLIKSIEGSLPEAHLRSLLQNKAKEVIGELHENQQAALAQYVEAHPSYSKIDAHELAAEILDCAT